MVTVVFACQSDDDFIFTENSFFGTRAGQAVDGLATLNSISNDDDTLGRLRFRNELPDGISEVIFIYQVPLRVGTHQIYPSVQTGQSLATDTLHVTSQASHESQSIGGFLITELDPANVLTVDSYEAGRMRGHVAFTARSATYPGYESVLPDTLLIDYTFDVQLDE